MHASIYVYVSYVVCKHFCYYFFWFPVCMRVCIYVYIYTYVYVYSGGGWRQDSAGAF